MKRIIVMALLLAAAGSATAAERTVERHDAEQFTQPGLSQDQLGVEKFLFVVEHFQVAGDAAFVADVRQIGGAAMSLRILLLARAKFPRALVGDEAI